jgi:ABC-type uncharacterized transport system auxiliary subunit
VQTAQAQSDQTLTLVNAFDAAMMQALQQIVGWTVAETR